MSDPSKGIKIEIPRYSILVEQISSMRDIWACNKKPIIYADIPTENHFIAQMLWYLITEGEWEASLQKRLSHET